MLAISLGARTCLQVRSVSEARAFILEDALAGDAALAVENQSIETVL